MENETITSAVCPQCGAPLTEADENGNMKCEFCGTVSLDNRYTIVRTTYDFGAELIHYLENAEELLSDGEYNLAFRKFEEITEQHSKDYRGWWGMARALTHNFTLMDLSEDKNARLQKYYAKALSKAPVENKEELETTIDSYNRAIEKEMICRLNRAEALLENEEYKLAFKEFSQTTDKYQKDYRGWWGMARAMTNDFTLTDLTEEQHKKLRNYVNSAKSKSPEEKKKELNEAYEAYKKAVEKADLKAYKEYMRSERIDWLITYSCPLSIIAYTIFMFVYSIIYILINFPEFGNAGGGIIGVIIPALIFGVAYGIWAMVQDSDNAIFGIYAAVALSAIDWGLAWTILGQQIGLTHLTIMPLCFAAAFLPGWFMTKKARGY